MRRYVVPYINKIMLIIQTRCLNSHIWSKIGRLKSSVAAVRSLGKLETIFHGGEHVSVKALCTRMKIKRLLSLFYAANACLRPLLQAPSRIMLSVHAISSQA